MAAENNISICEFTCLSACFNEAAANGRGKLLERGVSCCSSSSRFNEAAANGRGKRRLSSMAADFECTLQ